jgi:hypothetical protein
MSSRLDAGAHVDGVLAASAGVPAVWCQGALDARTLDEGGTGVLPDEKVVAHRAWNVADILRGRAPRVAECRF